MRARTCVTWYGLPGAFLLLRCCRGRLTPAVERAAGGITVRDEDVALPQKSSSHDSGPQEYDRGVPAPIDTSERRRRAKTSDDSIETGLVIEVDLNGEWGKVFDTLFD